MSLSRQCLVTSAPFAPSVCVRPAQHDACPTDSGSSSKRGAHVNAPPLAAIAAARCTIGFSGAFCHCLKIFSLYWLRLSPG